MCCESRPWSRKTEGCETYPSLIMSPSRTGASRNRMHRTQPLVLQPSDDDHADIHDREHEQPNRVRMCVAIELVDQEEPKGPDGGWVGPQPLLEQRDD